MPSNSSSPYRGKLIKLLSLNVKKKIAIFFQVILRSGSVSFIEVAAREIVCYGFNFNTTGTKWISCIFKNASKLVLTKVAKRRWLSFVNSSIPNRSLVINIEDFPFSRPNKFQQCITKNVAVTRAKNFWIKFILFTEKKNFWSIQLYKEIHGNMWWLSGWKIFIEQTQSLHPSSLLEVLRPQFLIQLITIKLPKKISQKQPSRGVLRKICSKNMQHIYRRTPKPKCDFNKVAKQLYWNCTSAWVLSCKFAAYFQNTFL